MKFKIFRTTDAKKAGDHSPIRSFEDMQDLEEWSRKNIDPVTGRRYPLVLTFVKNTIPTMEIYDDFRE